MYTKEEIVACLMESSRVFREYAGRTAENDFTQPTATGRWSIAEHLDHLTRSVKPLNLAISLPRFALRYFGRPNRTGRSYDELRQRYRDKLAQGGQAMGRYIPKVSATVQKQPLLQRYQQQVKKLVCRIDTLKEEELDDYLLPHPLLGKLTLREMFFFTIYHTYHHLDIIKRRND